MADVTKADQTNSNPVQAVVDDLITAMTRLSAETGTVPADLAINSIQSLAKVVNNTLGYYHEADMALDRHPVRVYLEDSEEEVESKQGQEVLQPHEKLYQAITIGELDDFAEAKQLLQTQPDLISQLQPDWLVETVFDFVRTKSTSADNIVWLLRSCGSDVAEKLLTKAELLPILMSNGYVTVLQELRVMGLLGPLQRMEMVTKAREMTEIVKLVFGDAVDE